jgi:hypothetical protein
MTNEIDFLTQLKNRWWDGLTQVKLLFVDEENDSIYLGGPLNSVKITKGGEMTFEGDATTWDDIRVVPGSFDRPGTSDPTIVTVTPDESGTSTWLYEFAKNNTASFQIQLPHSYDVGEDIYAHIHWTAADRAVDESGSAVGWKIDYTWTSINGTFQSMQTVDLSDTCDGVNWKHQMTPSVALDGTGKGISSMLICNIKRTDTGADDTWVSAANGQQPKLLEIDFHYPMNSVGSKEQAVK